MPRSGLSVLFSVWRALLLREGVTRLSSSPAAGLWILLEPLAHVVFLMILFGTIRQRTVYGVSGSLFIMTGVLAFILFRNIANRSRDAISANMALFAYRQVKPIDTVFSRALLEATLTLVAGIVLLLAATMIGLPVTIHDPILALAGFGSLALLGLGFGLVFSVVGDLIPSLAPLVSIAMTPLYFMSAVMYPAYVVPQPYRDLLLFNPIIHGVESVRAGFFASYRIPPNISLEYVGFVGLAMVFLGLALHVRYQVRLIAR